MLAPARQTIKRVEELGFVQRLRGDDDRDGLGPDGLRVGLRRVVDEGCELGLHAGRAVVGTQFIDLLGSALMNHHGPPVGGSGRSNRPVIRTIRMYTVAATPTSPG